MTDRQADVGTFRLITYFLVKNRITIILEVAMKYLFVCYKRCSTCAKARKWLNENGVEYEERDIKEFNPDEEELRKWVALSGLPVNKFYNTSGTLYRELHIKDKLPSMSDDEKIKLLATDGMLVKRPVIVGQDVVLAGFKEELWSEALNV